MADFGRISRSGESPINQPLYRRASAPSRAKKIFKQAQLDFDLSIKEPIKAYKEKKDKGLRTAAPAFKKALASNRKEITRRIARVFAGVEGQSSRIERIERLLQSTDTPVTAENYQKAFSLIQKSFEELKEVESYLNIPSQGIRDIESHLDILENYEKHKKDLFQQMKQVIETAQNDNKETDNKDNTNNANFFQQALSGFFQNPQSEIDRLNSASKDLEGLYPKDSNQRIILESQLQEKLEVMQIESNDMIKTIAKESGLNDLKIKLDKLQKQIPVDYLTTSNPETTNSLEPDSVNNDVTQLINNAKQEPGGWEKLIQGLKKRLGN